MTKEFEDFLTGEHVEMLAWCHVWTFPHSSFPLDLVLYPLHLLVPELQSL